MSANLIFNKRCFVKNYESFLRFSRNIIP